MSVLLPVARAICLRVSTPAGSAPEIIGFLIPAKVVVSNGRFVEFNGVRVVSRRG